MHRVVLLGQPGSGKTTLFNRLTGANEKTLAGGVTSTRELVCGQSIYETNFEVIDSPDLQCFEKGIHKIAGQIAGLQVGSINQIILVIKYQRYPFMKEQLESQLKLIERHLNNVTIYISFFDRCDQVVELREEEIIRDHIFKGFKLKQIIFNKKNLNDQSISSQIADILKFSNSFYFEINYNQIQNWVNYDDYDDEDDFDRKFLENLEIISRNVSGVFRLFLLRLFKNLDIIQLDNSKYIQFLQSLKEFIRSKAQTFLNYYALSLRHNEQFQFGEQNYILFLHLLKKSNIEFNQIMSRIQEKEKSYYFRTVKRCPYCGQIMENEQNCSKVECEFGCKNYFLWDENPDVKQLEYKIAITLKDTEIEELIERDEHQLSLLENHDILSKEVIQQIDDVKREFNENVQKLIANRKIIPNK